MMRELPRESLELASGGQNYSEYLPDDPVPVSVSTGYTIGAFAKSVTRGYQSSAADMAASLSTCHKRIKTFREVCAYVYELPPNSKPLNIASYFLCGVVMGLAGTAKKP